MTDVENRTESPDDGAFTPIYTDYSNDELLEQAQGNAQAALVATVGFLKDRDIPIAEWATALGRSFAGEWGEPEPWSADEFLDAMLANYRSLGAVVGRAEFGPDRSQAEITAFPDADLCDRFGVSVADVARFHDTAAAIAADRGLTWTWTLDETDEAETTTSLLVEVSAPASGLA